MTQPSPGLTPSGRPGFRARLVVAQVLIVVITVSVITAVVARTQHEQLTSDTHDRVLAVAQTLAAWPEVSAGVLADDTVALQSIADLVEAASGVDYVVITDERGIRLTHPNAAERGLPVSTSPDRVLAGETFVGVEVGTLGATLRAKVPVRSEGAIVGTASVGLLESTVTSRLGDAMGDLLPWVLAALALGSVAALLAGSVARRRFARLEAELSSLDGQRSVSEALSAHAHEFANRIHVVYGLVGRGENRLALDYIDSFAAVGTVAHAAVPSLGEPALDALLEAKAVLAASEGKSLLVESDDARPLQHAPADDDLITIVGNLISNALDAIDSGGTVTVTAARDDRAIVVVVDDDGAGIDPRDRARVFERGYTTKAAPRTGDRGIGLALVRQIVDRRGGHVSIDTSPLGGARFTVRVPHLSGAHRAEQVRPR